MDDATGAQIAAADPARSTWLAANAGSGKTRVLTDRVARLLLDGVPPQNVLCLTYTKAAASEMQNRLFRQLGEWAMEDDRGLRDALARKGVAGPLDTATLDRARRLFARAIETPGGLKIQTIHAFSAALLRRFPLEARVAPGFVELDDRSATALVDEVLEGLAAGPQIEALDAVAAHLAGGDDALGELARSVLGHRAAFDPPRDAGALRRLHGLPEEFEDTALAAEVFTGGEAALLDILLPTLAAGSTTDIRAAETLGAIRPRLGGVACLPGLEGIFLTGASARSPFTAKTEGRSQFPTRATQNALGPCTLDRLHDWMRRVEAARPRRLALASARRSAALHAFAAVFLPAMTAAKAARGVLDFDDLILKARALMSDPSVGEWVLYKLDGGIDHILVDEAQDTSPAQWDLISLLAREMAAGQGRRDDRARTVFVVGDKKQSIYSFQGADPRAFDRLRADFAERLAGKGPGLADRALEHSFRSAPAILTAVDATFAAPDAAAALGGAPTHRPVATDLPGRVDLWPALPKPEEPEPDAWFAPPDRLSPRSAAAQLADAIAGELRRLIDAGETVPDDKGGRKRLDEGDVVILLPRRGALFREIIRACKQRALAIAGADRLSLTRELAVKDLLALLRFVSLPEDDLSLAAALRSPLLGWSEDDLYRLAHPRKGYLWPELRRARPDGPTHALLSDLLDKADYLRPYDLLERVLTVHGGRERLLARLGPECEEAIDALLGAALSYEHADIPNLTGFLEWMGSGEVEIKRQAEGAGGRLRVMTVHGAKGLEGSLVILPDCADRELRLRDPVLVADDGAPVWKTTAPETVTPVAEAVAAAKASQSAENLRLLYVAMTRAKTWLWVCAAGSAGPESWHGRVAAGLQAAGAADAGFPTGQGLRLSTGDWHGTTPAPASPATAEARAIALPDWIDRPVPPEPPARETLTPSDLGGAKALPGEGDGDLDDARLRARGRHLHLLFEHLPLYPEAAWQHLAPGILRRDDDPVADLGALLEEAAAVLTDPALRDLFGPDTLAEVPLTLPLQDGRRLRGAIDRLVVTDRRVLAVDFKSNRLVPDSAAAVPEGLLRQMGAYATALHALYPGREVQAAILWTRRPSLMRLPIETITQAFQRGLAGRS